MTEDRIITREISAHHAWQGPESEAPVFCNDGPQLAALAEEIDMAERRAFSAGYEAALEAESNIKKINIAPTGDLISREAALEALRDEAKMQSHPSILWALDRAADCLRALPAQAQPAAPAVKVKPLAWHDCSDGTSHDDGCQYEIEQDGKLWRVARAVTGGGAYVCHADSLKVAKAAAQAHHEARILSALEGAQ